MRPSFQIQNPNGRLWGRWCEPELSQSCEVCSYRNLFIHWMPSHFSSCSSRCAGNLTVLSSVCSRQCCALISGLSWSGYVRRQMSNVQGLWGWQTVSCPVLILTLFWTGLKFFNSKQKYLHEKNWIKNISVLSDFSELSWMEQPHEKGQLFIFSVKRP